MILGALRAKGDAATLLRAWGGGEGSLGVGAVGGQAYWAAYEV